MDWDESKSTNSRSLILGEDLSRLSLAEMEQRITALVAEIDRIKAALAARREHDRRAADLFKS